MKEVKCSDLLSRMDKCSHYVIDHSTRSPPKPIRSSYVVLDIHASSAKVQDGRAQARMPLDLCDRNIFRWRRLRYCRCALTQIRRTRRGDVVQRGVLQVEQFSVESVFARCM